MLILDSPNDIKGYRYELWCVARGAATRYCLVSGLLQQLLVRSCPCTCPG